MVVTIICFAFENVFFYFQYLYEDVNNSEEEIKDNDYAHLQIMKRTNKSVP